MYIKIKDTSLMKFYLTLSSYEILNFFIVFLIFPENIFNKRKVKAKVPKI